MKDSDRFECTRSYGRGFLLNLLQSRSRDCANHVDDAVNPGRSFTSAMAAVGRTFSLRLGVLVAFELAIAPCVGAREALESYTRADSHCDQAGNQVTTFRHAWAHGAQRPATVVEFTVRDPGAVKVGVPFQVAVREPVAARLTIYRRCDKPMQGCAGSDVLRAGKIESVVLTLTAGQLIAGERISGTFQLREMGYAPGVSQVGAFERVPVQAKSKGSDQCN